VIFKVLHSAVLMKLGYFILYFSSHTMQLIRIW